MAKLLIIDDSETLRSALRKDLEESGFHVCEAKDGLEGLAIMNEVGPQIELIVTDINMPNMSGLQFAQRLKDDLPQISIPIFMLTTEANSEMKAMAKAFGVRAWITKPYSKDKLVVAVKKVLNLPQG
jgi:two-component system chemotaxis response regulator CheY